MEISKQLITNCLKKDDTAINELYQRCFSLMKGISLRYQHSEVDAEIAFNQGFLKVVNNLHKYDQARSFKSWFTRVIVNTNIDIYRSKKRHNELTVYKEEFSGDESYVKVEDDYNLEIDYETIIEFVKTLTPMSQKIFNLYVIDGYSHREIADLLEISDGTSKWHLHAARKALQTKVNDFIKSKKMAV